MACYQSSYLMILLVSLQVILPACQETTETFPEFCCMAYFIFPSSSQYHIAALDTLCVNVLIKNCFVPCSFQTNQLYNYLDRGTSVINVLHVSSVVKIFHPNSNKITIGGASFLRIIFSMNPDVCMMWSYYHAQFTTWHPSSRRE